MTVLIKGMIMKYKADFVILEQRKTLSSYQLHNVGVSNCRKLLANYYEDKVKQ